MDQREKLARESGVEAGLAIALGVLHDLAEVMLERERAAKPGSKANYARRTRIKAYQVASRRIQTRLGRQRAIVAKLESPEDQRQHEARLKAEIESLDL